MTVTEKIIKALNRGRTLSYTQIKAMGAANPSATVSDLVRYGHYTGLVKGKNRRGATTVRAA